MYLKQRQKYDGEVCYHKQCTKYVILLFLLRGEKLLTEFDFEKLSNEVGLLYDDLFASGTVM